jgi:hypothetical protein
VREDRRFLDSGPGTRQHRDALIPTRVHRASQEAEEAVDMLAVIGNVLAGLGVLSLFTATLRLSKPGQRA